MILIGSSAIGAWFPGFREPKDSDWFSRSKVEGFDCFWDERLLGYAPWFRPLNTGRATVATPDELYTIKISHSFWNIKGTSWEKHIEDAMWLKSVGARLIPELYQILYPIWIDKHGSKKMSLAKDAMNFFDKDAVVRIYDHDSIHASVAYGEHPMYEKILKDGADVEVDSKKMWALSEEDLEKLFREEVMATALERWLIPSDYTYSPRRAYAQALNKTITSLTKGKSALWIAERYDKMKKPDHDYLARHLAQKDRLIRLENQ